MINAALRIRIIFGFILAFAALLAVKLYFVQVVEGADFSERAERQYLRPNTSLYDRGEIYFTRKDGTQVPAATLKSGYVVSINPQLIIDAEDVYEALAGAIELDREEFMAKATKPDDPYEEIAERVPPDVAGKIEKLGLDGVQIYKERWRFYPGGSVGSDVLGFVGYTGDTLEGQYGLERYYEDTLAREDGQRFVNFFAEVFSNVQRNLLGAGEFDGNVVTSVEPTVQLFLEKRLEEINKEWSSPLTGGIIIDPNTGDIYAMADYPSYDPNAYGKVEKARVFASTAVEDVYEMGSIIKPITMAAGIDAGVVTPDETYYDGGSLEINGSTISNYDGVGRGEVDMQHVLNHSLNTGAVYVMREMGKSRFADYLERFRIGSETGIDLPNEAQGIMDNLDSTREIEYATASYGQGIAMTPIATVRALSALANGGFLVDPHIGQKITYESGVSKKVEGAPKKRVLKDETSDTITNMLIEVVDDALLNGEVKLANYSVAAKTGTAQIADSERGGYYENRFFHSFFGYFPAHEPRFLVFLYTYDPKSVRYSSQTLTHPFMDLTKFLINYYEIPPDRKPAEDLSMLKDL